MTNVLTVFDKNKKRVYLTDERYNHILKHPDMQNMLEEIRDIIENPLKIINYSTEDKIKYYYKYYKDRKSKAKYLRVIVKYLNGKGFIITAYFVERI